MRKKIVGVTVGTTINPKVLEKTLKPVKTVNGVEPDENGNVQVGGSAEAVQANLDAHNQSKKNPHTWKPTAEEVGARPDDWMPTAEQVGARPDNWMPSATDVGAAPAGYGLGTETVRRVTIAELDTLTSNGWYLVNNNKTGLTLNNEPFNWAICRVLGANDQWNVKQELFPIGVNNLKIIRAKETETTWYPWECDNPTMTPGVEYRTTERWNGKPVYAMLVNLGTLPNATSGAVPLPITGAEKFIEYNLVETSTSNPSYQNLNTTDIELVFGFNNPGSTNGSSWVDIHAKANHSAYTGELSMKYTKV